MSDNTKKAQCIHCFHFFSKDFNSTLKNRISHPHCEALKRVSESEQSSMSRDESIFVYNPDVLRKQFAGLVIQRGLPFNHFDDEQTTRVFQKYLQPKYNHVSRTTLKRDAMKLWVAAKQAIIDDFLKLNTNVSLTTDIWSSPHGVPGHLDAQERKQDKSTLETLVDFEEEILDADVQVNEAIPLSDEKIALDAASSESGPEEDPIDYPANEKDNDDNESSDDDDDDDVEKEREDDEEEEHLALVDLSVVPIDDPVPLN
nr:zinc finger BED domain-containing protein RICESLEEPER 2-like [Tanacetum cinerariifolium]